MRKLFLLLLIFTAISCKKQKDFNICEYKGEVVAGKDHDFAGILSKEVNYLYFEDGCSYKKVEVPSFYYDKYEIGDEIGGLTQRELIEKEIKELDSIISSYD